MWHGSKAFFLLVLIGATLPRVGYSETAVEQVGAALDNLNRWLGDNENARTWKRFLHTDDLINQLALGSAADRNRVAAIHATYAEKAPGLERQPFAAVRAGLERWLSELAVPLTDVPAALRAQRDRYHPLPADRVAAARRRLTTSLQSLEEFLAGGGEENAKSWKQYLHWDALRNELAKEAGPNPVELTNIADFYTANEKGLELPYFAEVRSALHDYAYAAYFSQSSQVKDTYAQHLEEIAKRLESFSQSPNAGDSAAIGRSLGWLERGGQVPELVASVRNQFARPNLYAEVSQRLISSGLETEEVRAKLNRPAAVNDVILKTSIRGTAYPNLDLGILLVPDDQRASFELHLAGAASSNSIGQRGPVTVYTTGYTTISAAKRVYFDKNGVTSGGTSAQCSTASQINDISARCGLIEKMAWKKAGQSKSQAESIASARAASRIERQLDREVSARLAETNQNYADRFRNRLLRRDGFPRVFRASTTSQAVSLKVLHATPQQLSTNSEPPALTPGHDLAVRLHESAVINFGESLVGGVTLSDERLVELLTESKAEIPEELKITPDKDPWSITFTPERPVSAVFAGNTVKFAIRGRRFTRGDQEVRAIMEISATYSLEKSGTGSKLTRQGDVVAEYVTTKQQSIGEVAMKTFLRKKFEALFKPEITSDGLKLPEQLKTAGKLHLQQLSADRGWLTLGWTRSEAKEDKVALVSGE